MKLSDRFLPNGLLFSGARNDVKANQHDEKVVVEWVGDAWIVRRVPPPSSERIDAVPHDPAATAWRRAARSHQSKWRVEAGWPAGRQLIGGQQRSEPTAALPDTESASRYRPIGSRVDPDFAKKTGCNFLDDDIRAAVRHRLANPQPHQTLSEERLWSDLLSSMPMCFNLFGPLWDNPRRAAEAVQRWFPDMWLPNSTVSVSFEWSPGRRNPQWLGDRTAFDAAIEITSDDRRHLIGIETKYHEHPFAESHEGDVPVRYLEVAKASSLCDEQTARNRIWGHATEQVWRDHLLALACAQRTDGWDRVRYVLVAPHQNPAWQPLVEEYRSLIHPDARASVEYVSVETLLEQARDVLPQASGFKARYLAVAPTDDN